VKVKSKLKSTARKVARALTPQGHGNGERDILDTLKQEHEEVKGLLADLEQAQSGAQRRSLVEKIKLALVPHTKAEQKVLYDAVIKLRDKDAQQDGYEGYLEHEWASKTLQRLDSMPDATSPEHKATAKVLKELVEHHIEEEESNVWGDAEKNFSSEQRVRMNAAYESAKSRVRVP
jgi:hemerythrin-like domain-containing protein